MASLGGASVEDVGTSIRILQRNLDAASRGNVQASQTFSQLGVSIRDASGEMMPAELVLAGIAERFKALPPGTRRTAAAMELFGRSGAKMIPTLKDGAQAMAALGDQVRDAGAVFSDETAEDAAKMEFQLKLVELQVTGLRNKLGTRLIPVVTQVVDKIAKWIDANKAIIEQRLDQFVATLTSIVTAAWEAFVKLAAAVQTTWEWLREHPTVLALVISGLELLVAALAVGKLLQFVGAIKEMILVLKSLWVVMMANPIAALMVIIGTLIAYTIANWDEIKSAWGDVWFAMTQAAEWAAGKFKAAWKAVSDWFTSNIVGPIKETWSNIKEIADYIGIGGGGGGGSHSPGRPGTQESGIRPDALSTGLLYNAPLAAAMGYGGGGAGATLSIGAINVSVASTSSTARDIGDEVRTVVRSELNRMTRMAALDVR
ncbi:MAG: phage tail tape measure protein [Pseudomonadota bacterium]